MYSEHKHLGDEESTASRPASPVLKRVEAV